MCLNILLNGASRLQHDNKFSLIQKNAKIMIGPKDHIPVLVNIHVAEIESSLSPQKDFLAKNA